MKIKIAVYDDPAVKPLFANSESLPDVSIFKTDEKTALDLLINSKVDCALLNPLTYSLAAGKSDLRIIPSPMIISEGYTKLMSLFFKENLREFVTCGVPTGAGFLTQIFEILLQERYDMEPEFIEDKRSLYEMLQNFDAAIIQGFIDDNENCLDLSEDWFQSYEIPLLTAFWAIRNEEAPENIVQILTSLAKGGISPTAIQASGNNEYDREGKIEKVWNDDAHDSLSHILHLLYYRQLIDKVPEIKVYGIEPVL